MRSYRIVPHKAAGSQRHRQRRPSQGHSRNHAIKISGNHAASSNKLWIRRSVESRQITTLQGAAPQQGARKIRVPDVPAMEGHCGRRSGGRTRPYLWQFSRCPTAVLALGSRWAPGAMCIMGMEAVCASLWPLIRRSLLIRRPLRNRFLRQVTETQYTPLHETG